MHFNVLSFIAHPLFYVPPGTSMKTLFAQKFVREIARSLKTLNGQWFSTTMTKRIFTNYFNFLFWFEMKIEKRCVGNTNSANMNLSFEC